MAKNGRDKVHGLGAYLVVLRLDGAGATGLVSGRAQCAVHHRALQFFIGDSCPHASCNWLAWYETTMGGIALPRIYDPLTRFHFAATLRRVAIDLDASWRCCYPTNGYQCIRRG